MPRLVVFRGDAIEKEITLAGVAIRIGRDKQNDLVLSDPDKGVSRVHAEIRPEGKTYTIVDLNSRNGIWINKQTTKQATLTPGVPVTIGPYELMLEDQGSSQIFTAAAPSPLAQPVSTPSAGLTEKVIQPSPPSQPVRSARPAANPRTRAQQRKWLVGGAAALAAVAVIATGTILMRRPAPPPPPPTEKPEQVVARLAAAATSQIEQGACADALRTNIEPAIAMDPGNADLQTLKGRAEACVQAATPPTPPESGVNSTSAELDAATAALAIRDCAGALGHINTVLNTEPENAAAIDLKKRAEACSKPSVPPPPVGPRVQVAIRVAPEQGGLEPKPGELDKDYKNRLTQMKSRYDEAVALAAKGPSRGAIAALEGIESEATDKYLEVHAKLEQARTAWRDTARPVVNEARDLVRKKAWVDARSKFKEAVDIDPGLEGPLAGDLRGVQEGMLADGRAACGNGRKFGNYPESVPKAIEYYKQAQTLVPQTDACWAEAQKFLEARGAAGNSVK